VQALLVAAVPEINLQGIGLLAAQGGEIRGAQVFKRVEHSQ
jgi:hypothetical protein